VRPALRPLIALLVAAPVQGAERPSGGSIHGTLRTTGGEVLEGTIRWGRAAFWDDTLGAQEVQPADPAHDGFRLSLFGWKLIDAGGDRVAHRVMVPFGHLSAVEPTLRDQAVLELKGGRTLTVEASGEGIGSGLDLTIDVAGRGRIELPWRRVARVDFSDGPIQVQESERLFGTVTATGSEFVGFVEWDRDERSAGEILDGEEDTRERDIPFREIAAIEPAGPSSARVVLRSGETVTLGGTNDVDESNRGTVVHVARLGMVTVPWDRLVRVDFRSPAPSLAYDRFDGGRPLRGSVRTVDGAVRRGSVEWDRDETFDWETLDGECDGLHYRIPFALVRSIARSEDGGSTVVLRDGRSLLLSGTNDVDASNRGIVVTEPGGVATTIDWSDFVSLALD